MYATTITNVNMGVG